MKKIYKLFFIGVIFILVGVFGFLKISSDEKIENEPESLPEVVEEVKNIKTTLMAGGDVMLSRHVGTKIREAGDNSLPFRELGNLFSEADIAFINLEAPFYNKGEYVTEGMVFKSEPETIAGLSLAGIDVVSLANNHARNKGEAGLLYTYNHLLENNIEYVGAGKNFTEAHQAKILEKEGIKFAFLAYTYSDGNGFVSSVNENDPDVAFMDIVEMKKDVERARKSSDVVVVSMHAGIEYKSYPNKQQKEFAREAINSGAKLVLGHHPHVVQSVEKYGHGFIIYSMGNLVFDQMWSEETREGVVASLQFTNNRLGRIEFIPIKIENYNQPRIASFDESKVILNRMGLEKPEIDF